MLLELNIKDIALIKKASVEFGEGLNIITGETGAGKSVVIDSILAALGGKAKADIIRKNAEYAYIELIFSVDEEAGQKLKELGVYPDDNGEIVISRRIMPKRSVSRINDETVTVSKLKDISRVLIDIYGQNEFHTLMDKKRHLSILDAYIAKKAGDLKGKVREAFSEYKKARKQTLEYTMDERQRLKEYDILSYELNEITEADLKEGEEEELSAYYKKLNNMSNIAGSAESARQNMSGFELERAIADIEQGMKYDGALKGVYDELIDAQSILESALKDLGAYINDLEVDEEELTNTERRLDKIRSLEAKYGRDIAEINAYKESIAERLDVLSNYEEKKNEALKRLEETKKNLGKLCAELSEKRKEGASRLTGAIEKELKSLGFKNASVSMEFSETEPDESGSDEVVFLAAFNIGETIRPLQEVASGGELSRFMLALKTVQAESDDVPTLIFDEIDTGISGRAAQNVAEKMALISKKHQAICVSHLPQIAAMADTHFAISKEETDGRNVTDIFRLSEEGSLNELARLLGGAQITKAVYDNAMEMKQFAQKIKQEKGYL